MCLLENYGSAHHDMDVPILTDDEKYRFLDVDRGWYVPVSLQCQVELKIRCFEIKKVFFFGGRGIE